MVIIENTMLVVLVIFTIFIIYLFWANKRYGLYPPILIYSGVLILILFLFYLFFIPSKGGFFHDNIDLPNNDGKILINWPDSIKIHENTRIRIRVAKLSFNSIVFFSGLDSIKKKFIDTIEISEIVEVNLKEINHNKKVVIERLNNSSVQALNLSHYNEWLFNIEAVAIGKTTLVVSASIFKETEFGPHKFDIPVFEKKIEIYVTENGEVEKNEFSTPTAKKKNETLEKRPGKPKMGPYELNALILVFLLVIFLSIIIMTMSNKNSSNFWGAGSLGLLIYIVTIASMVIFKMLNVNLWFVPLVFIGTILIYAIFTAVTLRDNNKLSEENFLKLMGEALKKIPPLNWIFKDGTDDVKKP